MEAPLNGILRIEASVGSEKVYEKFSLIIPVIERIVHT